MSFSLFPAPTIHRPLSHERQASIQPLGPQFRKAQFRALLAKHAVFIGGISVFIIFICVMTIRSCSAEPEITLPTVSNNAYFYDIQDSTLVELPDNLIPPVKQGSHELVRAMVFACKSCADPADRFTGYLKSFTPERKKAEEAIRQDMKPGEELPLGELKRLDALGGVLIRNPIGNKFIPSDDPDAQPIYDEFNTKCPNSMIECKPR